MTTEIKPYFMSICMCFYSCMNTILTLLFTVHYFYLVVCIK